MQLVLNRSYKNLGTVKKYNFFEVIKISRSKRMIIFCNKAINLMHEVQKKCQ